MTSSAEQLWAQVATDVHDLAPCVVQDIRTRAVLMVAWVSKEALARTLDTGYAVYFSRARQTLWEKGAVSGNRQRIVHVRLDNDKDTLLYLVDAKLPAGNDGSDTYFNYRRHGAAWVWDPVQLTPDTLDGADDRTQPAPTGPRAAAGSGSAPAAPTIPELDVTFRQQAARFVDTRDVAGTLQVATDLVETLVQTLEDRGLSLRKVLVNLERRIKS